MNLIDRACHLHARTLRPWIVPQAFHVHPETATRMERECDGMRLVPLRPSMPWPAPLRLETIKGIALVRDPRVPEGVIALQFKNTTGWPLVT